MREATYERKSEESQQRKRERELSKIFTDHLSLKNGLHRVWWRRRFLFRDI
jgi:hypothetical protein